MEKRIMLWIIIGLLFLIALYLLFQTGGSSGIQGAAVQSGQASVASASSGMVGGC